MSDAIDVAAAGASLYTVTVRRAATTHSVTARPAALSRVARPGETPEATIVRAFEFLLAREPASSILPRFALEDIARYFPDFWTQMV